MTKVLFQVLCLEQEHIELEILEPAIFKIVNNLKKLYIETI